MQNFPQLNAEHLRKLRTDLAVHSPGDPVWEGAVGQLLQMLIDTDLAHHRTDKKEPVDFKLSEPVQHSIFQEQTLVEKKPEPSPEQAW